MLQDEFIKKVVVVTGSSKGIGFHIATDFLKCGARVVFNGRNEDDLLAIREAYATYPIHTVVADVTVPAQAKELIDATIRAFGHIDILVTNVGSGRSVSPGGESFEEWQRVFNLNLWSATNVIEAARSYLEQTKGVIVAISSICGVEIVQGAPVTYSAAKAALNTYVRGVSKPLGRKGIRINAVAPGNINFLGSVWERKLNDNADAVNDFLNDNVALQKLGTPVDVSNMVLWLSSSKANFVTGGIYLVDGGQVH